VAGTYDGTTVRFYVDGQQVGDGVPEPDGIGYNLSGGNDLTIGNFFPGFPGYNFSGSIDDVQIYNRALNASEIQAIYNGGSAGNSADLMTTNTAAASVTPGGNLTYTIKVTNQGPAAAQSLSLTDAIPANTTFVSFTAPSGWTPTTPAVGGTGTIAATTAALAPGATATFSLVVQVDPTTSDGTSLADIATAAAATNDPNLANNTAMASTPVNRVSADLSVAVSGPVLTVKPGSLEDLVLVLNNGGPDPAQSVSVTDAVPAGTTFASFTAPPGWTVLTPAVGGTGTITATTPTFGVGVAASTDLDLRVRVDPTVPDGTHITDTATISSPTHDPNPANNTGSGGFLVNGPPPITGADLSVGVSGPVLTVKPGSLEDLLLVLNNGGPDPAQSVSVTDAVPAGTTFVSFTAPPGWTVHTPAVGRTGTITATTPTFGVGVAASTDLDLRVRVDRTVPDGTHITDTAKITSPTHDPNPANNRGSGGFLVITPSADVGVYIPRLVYAGGGIAPGQEVFLDLVVSNDGPDTASPVTLTDVVPAGTSFVSFTAPSGWRTLALRGPRGGIGSVIATADALTRGGVSAFLLTVRVNSAEPTRKITDTAKVSATTHDPHPKNNVFSRGFLVT
jgi:uncharacterized repeat protein (TIGR01451 family)